MFNSKQEKLFNSGKIKEQKASGFLTAGLKKEAKTVSGNGAAKFDKLDDEFVTDFTNVSGYKAPREFNAISKTMSILWAISPLLALKLTLYVRMITRKVQLWNGNTTEEIQKGQGLKHEGIFRMMWVSIYHPNTFWKNIELFISVGSWKDIITMLSYDLQYNGWNNRVLDWNKFGKLLLAGLENPNTSELVKKYLPQIKSNTQCTTLESQADNIISKWICSLLFGGKKESYVNYKSYRLLKSKGTAHQWQQLISQGKHNLVDFDTIHGRALSQLVSSKYLHNQGLIEKYQEWISKKPVAKFTGYVYELASKINYNLPKHQADTINKQYQTLLENAGVNNSNFIVVKDTSGSMDYDAHGTNMSSYHIAKSLSIYFANLLQGYFSNHYIDFSSKAILRKVQGGNFVEHWNTENRVQSANTNFLAVAELFADIKSKGVPESEFPKGLIIISDGEFDRTGMHKDTNIKAFRIILKKAGFTKTFRDELTFVFWDIRNGFYGDHLNTKFETYNSTKYKVFYFGGYDGSVISFLTGQESKNKPTPKNAKELFLTAMDQEVLNRIEI
jgi:hypothetical protein